MTFVNWSHHIFMVERFSFFFLSKNKFDDFLLFCLHWCTVQNSKLDYSKGNKCDFIVIHHQLESEEEVLLWLTCIPFFHIEKCINLREHESINCFTAIFPFVSYILWALQLRNTFHSRSRSHKTGKLVKRSEIIAIFHAIDVHECTHFAYKSKQ